MFVMNKTTKQIKLDCYETPEILDIKPISTVSGQNQSDPEQEGTGDEGDGGDDL